MFLPVKELHQQMDSRDVPKEKPKKPDHLIQGPAAGEGLHNRLQCQGWTNSVPLGKNFSFSFTVPQFL